MEGSRIGDPAESDDRSRRGGNEEGTEWSREALMADEYREIIAEIPWFLRRKAFATEKAPIIY